MFTNKVGVNSKAEWEKSESYEVNKNQWKISEVTFYIPVPNENSIDVCDLFSDGNPDQIKSWFCKQNHG